VIAAEPCTSWASGPSVVRRDTARSRAPERALPSSAATRRAPTPPALQSSGLGRRGSGLVALVAARAERWLLEPASPRPRAADPPPETRPVVAVIGLGPRCGATTVARALGVELAKRARGGAAIVSAVARGPAPALATAPARRLARALPPDIASAAGRLCLIDDEDPAVRELATSRPAPLVLDVPHGRAPETAFALADSTILVASPLIEPALADVVAASLTREHRSPAIVLTRVADDDGDWTGRQVLLEVPEARLGARLALAGRDPTPAIARPVAELADMLAEEASP
jgi:hypothetical protein